MNNLSYFEMIKDINNLLSKYNKDEIITAIIEEYTKDSVQNCQSLLDFIPKIAKHSMSILEKEISKKNTALYMLMIQNDIKIEGNEKAYFATMIPVCLTYFPKGKAEGGGKTEKDYFDLFCKLFKNEKAFSWERDKDWADRFGYSEYLRLVESQLEE